MHPWLEMKLRALLRERCGIDEYGQAELILIALIAFLIGVLATGHRIVVQ